MHSEMLQMGSIFQLFCIILLPVLVQCGAKKKQSKVPMIQQPPVKAATSLSNVSGFSNEQPCKVIEVSQADGDEKDKEGAKKSEKKNADRKDDKQSEKKTEKTKTETKDEEEKKEEKKSEKKTEEDKKSEEKKTEDKKPEEKKSDRKKSDRKQSEKKSTSKRADKTAVDDGKTAVPAAAVLPAPGAAPGSTLPKTAVPALAPAPIVPTPAVPVVVQDVNANIKQEGLVENPIITEQSENSGRKTPPLKPDPPKEAPKPVEKDALASNQVNAKKLKKASSNSDQDKTALAKKGVSKTAVDEKPSEQPKKLKSKTVLDGENKSKGKSKAK